LTTIESNVMGTANLLNAVQLYAETTARQCPTVVVTSDKCYDNQERGKPFIEGDPLGGADIYSASKGAAEIVAAAWRSSFLSGSPMAVATCRAGNVIGGGDWAKDRIVPDCIRSLQAKQPVPVRSPRSVRPWQHVLEPLSGYLIVGSRLADDPEIGSAWNFGPDPEQHRTVGDLVEAIVTAWGEGRWMAAPAADGMHESVVLRLATDKARQRLGWEPVWDLAETVGATVDWYRAGESADVAEITRRQIEAYTTAAAQRGLSWATT
jgi:CDP-glucose 4,6-dehydratase